VTIANQHFNLAEGQQVYGGRLHRYARYLEQMDPLADDVVAAFSALPAGRAQRMLNTALDEGIDAVPDPPPALRRLFAQLDSVPLWVDWAQQDRGGAAFLRSGPLGVAVIAYYGLPLSYCSPSGNKPLVFSGRMTERAARRLGETGRFVLATCQPGALQRRSAGFKITVKVRLMHAQVRRLLERSGRWRTEAWGAPINQCYLAGTNLLFSGALILGLRRCGFRFSRDESEALMGLWRYSGYLMGIQPELLCSTEGEAVWLSKIITMVDKAPDADARMLVKALMETPPTPQSLAAGWTPALAYGVSRALIGDTRADELGFPRTSWRLVVPAARPLVLAGDLVRRYIPGGATVADTLGRRVWHWAVESNLAGVPADFALPQRLGNRQ
jgi:hypothetical protein